MNFFLNLTIKDAIQLKWIWKITSIYGFFIKENLIQIGAMNKYIDEEQDNLLYNNNDIIIINNNKPFQ